MFSKSIGFVVSIAVLWFPLSSFAIGLGNLTVESRLASPLEARVIVNGIERENLDPELFIIKLESKISASIPKLFYRLEPSNGGATSILIYSRQAVMSPLFDLRLLVEWDNGSIERTYNIFIDPPSYELETASDSDLANLSSQGTISIPQATKVAPASTAVDSSSEPQLENKDDSFNIAVIEPLIKKGRTYGPTVSGNSLWRVAKKVKSGNESLSVYQWMHGIWKENPDAFRQQNMHRLRLNSLLGIPLEQDVSKVSHTSAYQSFAAHLKILKSVQASNKDIVTELSLVEPEALAVIPLLAGETAVEAAIGTNVEAAAQLSSAVIEAVSEADDQNRVINDLQASAELEGQPLVDVKVELVATAKNSTDINALNQKELSAATTLDDDLIVEDVAMAAASTPSQTLDTETGTKVITNEASGSVDYGVRWLDERLSAAPGWFNMLLGGLATLLLLALIRFMRGKPRPVNSDPAKAEVIDPTLAVEAKANLNAISDVDIDTSQPYENLQADKTIATESVVDVNSILIEVDVLTTYGHSDAAESLLSDAITQYPNETALGLHLLKLFYKNRNLVAFEQLFEKMRPVIACLDESEQASWQLKLNDLCPDSPSIVSSGQLKDEEITAVVDSDRLAEDRLGEADMAMKEHTVATEIPPDYLETIKIEPDSVESTEVLSMENKTSIEWDLVDQGSEDTLKISGLAASENDQPDDGDMELKEHTDVTEIPSDYLETIKIEPDSVEPTELLSMDNESSMEWDLVDQGSEDTLEIFGFTASENDQPSNTGYEVDHLLDDSSNQIDQNKDTLESFGFSDDVAELSERVDAATNDSGKSDDSDRLAEQDDLATQSETFQNELTSLILDDAEQPEDARNSGNELDLETNNSLEFYETVEVSLDNLPDEVGDTLSFFEEENSTAELATEVVDTLAFIEEENTTAELATEVVDTLAFIEEDDSTAELATEVVDSVEAKQDSDEPEVAGKTHTPNIRQFDGHILNFREKTNREEKTIEFEEKLMDTLQTMRDQMQQMNERLFSQERENMRLRKALDDLSSGRTDLRGKA